MSSTKLLTKDDVNKALEKSLSDIFANDRFKDLLKVMANNKSYSLNNSLLIVAQKPTATMTMGYKDWKKLGRQVNAGEKGIRILAPYMKKIDVEKIDPKTKQPIRDEKGNVVTEKRERPIGYFQVSVFDVSQTQGKEIPKIKDFVKFNMQDDDYISKLYKDYKEFLINTKNNVIDERPTEEGVAGYYSRANDEIVISSTENKNDTEKFQVLVHEYAHSLLHHKESDLKDLPRGHKEAQAESVAYVVNQYYGLDTSDSSIGYIARWSKDIKLAKQALNEVRHVSNAIIDDIDHLQKEKIQSFYKDQNKDYDAAIKHLIEYHGINEKVFDPDNNTETRLQLINKENGYIMSAKLEYNPKTENFYFKTNRNLIEPVSEIAKDGSLAVLNVEKEMDHLKEFKTYSRIPEHFEVQKVKDAYVIQSSNGQDIISKGFTKKEDAIEFQKRAAVAQALHQSTILNIEKNNAELQSDMQEIRTEIEDQINKTVGDYLSSHSKKSFRPIGSSGITIGWTLLKNPNLKTVEDVKEFAEQNKHLPSYKKLQNAIVHEDDKPEKKEKPKEKKVVIEEEYEQIIER